MQDFLNFPENKASYSALHLLSYKDVLIQVYEARPGIVSFIFYRIGHIFPSIKKI